MSAPSTSDIATTGPMFGAIVTGCAFGVMGLFVGLFVFGSLRNRIARSRAEAALKRRFDAPTPLREGPTAVVGTVVGEPDDDRVLLGRITEIASTSQRTTKWLETSRSIELRKFWLEEEKTGAKVKVVLKDAVAVVDYESTPARSGTVRTTEVSVLPGDRILVEGVLSRRTAKPSEGNDYRETPYTWRLTAPADGRIVVTRADATRGIRGSTARSERRMSGIFGALGALTVVFALAHFALFQITGVSTQGRVTRRFTSAPNKGRTTEMAQITFSDAAGIEHTLDRGLPYFVGPVNVGQTVRVKYLPLAPGDCELDHGRIGIGIAELIALAVASVPLALGAIMSLRRIQWGVPLVFSRGSSRTG